MGNQSIRVSGDRFQESMGFKFFHGMEERHGRVAANDLIEELPIIAKAFPIWNQDKSVLPAH